LPALVVGEDAGEHEVGEPSFKGTHASIEVFPAVFLASK